MPPKKKSGGNTPAANQPLNQIEVNNNNIYFNNDITSDSVAELCDHLRAMDEKLIAIKANYRIEDEIPIYLHLSSYGGSIYAALAAFDAISSIKTPVYTVIDGYVSSSGTVLSLAGEKRFIKPNAFVYLHELTTIIWGRMTHINVDLHNTEKVMERVIKIYVQKTKFSEEKLRQILKKDSTYNAKSVIEYGIAHEIYK